MINVYKSIDNYVSLLYYNNWKEVITMKNLFNVKVASPYDDEQSIKVTTLISRLWLPVLIALACVWFAFIG